jgi:hypothetical protein
MITIAEAPNKPEPPKTVKVADLANGLYRASLYHGGERRVFLRCYDGLVDILKPGDTYGDGNTVHNVEELDGVLTVSPK